MSSKKVITGATIINEGKAFVGDLFIVDDKIEKITKQSDNNYGDYEIIPAKGLFLLPGVIDDQVHFRDPGLTYKGDIYTESKAAVAGGVTSYMEMPNTDPPAVTIDILEEKYTKASQNSLANYSFYMGASNENIEEIVKVDPKKVCGVKVFMGSSTGNLLVDKQKALEEIFDKAPTLVATHCEDEETIQNNNQKFLKKYGVDAPTKIHPELRSAEACFLSSSKAVKLAEKYGTRLHILHLTTADEMDLFRNDIPLKEKKITAEVCVHHLWFSDEDYEEKGNFIKWNPAIKSKKDREALRLAVNNNTIDVVATDHAPHSEEEKRKPYFMAPSGGPLVQHSLVAMLQMVRNGIFSIEKVVEKMCHHPAELFRVEKRGFIREGYFADLVLLDLNSEWAVDKSNIVYKSKWSPFEGETFNSKVVKTLVNGNLVYDSGVFNENIKGKRLLFNHE
ncbi:MAG: dihydroorotase [Marinilabiliales bacterium]|nr:MAG: dihydroorotase [Marinilabiliales bacterium]